MGDAALTTELGSVLVTGGSGFIGSHVSQYLLSRGDRVIGLDNLNNYYDPGRKRANLTEIEKANFTFVEGDIGGELRRAATLYAQEVAEGVFPADEHSF